MQFASKEQALPGRDDKISLSDKNFVNKNALNSPFDKNLQQITFGMDCFWGAERKFWSLDGVYTTAVGYATGIKPNPI